MCVRSRTKVEIVKSYACVHLEALNIVTYASSQNMEPPKPCASSRALPIHNKQIIRKSHVKDALRFPQRSLCVNPPNITTNSLRLVSSKILAIVKIYAPCPLPTKTIMGRLHAATTHRIISIPYTVRSLPFQIKDRNRHGAPANATRMPSTPLRIHPPKAPYHQNYFLRLLKPW
jgi:hypothetical protein